MHAGISMSHFTLGRMGENSSADFGKASVGNELLGNAFWEGMMPSTRYERGRQAEKLAQMNLRSNSSRSSFALMSFWVHSNCAFATSETDVSGCTQAALSRQLAVPFDRDIASKLHDGELLRSMGFIQKINNSPLL